MAIETLERLTEHFPDTDTPEKQPDFGDIEFPDTDRPVKILPGEAVSAVTPKTAPDPMS